MASRHEQVKTIWKDLTPVQQRTVKTRYHCKKAKWVTKDYVDALHVFLDEGDSDTSDNLCWRRRRNQKWLG